MTQVTADLEYFKCDVCGVYLHKDIFCNHRRDCKGLNSQELKKSECRALEAELSEETRRLIAAREAQKGQMEGETTTTTNSVSITSTGAARTPPPAAEAAVKVHLSVDEVDRRREARVRRQVAEEFDVKQDQAFEQKYSEEKIRALMDFLNEE